MNDPLETKHSSFLRLKFAADTETEGVFEGYGAVYGNVDQGGDIIEPGAFAVSLAEHKKAGTTPVMLWMHKMDEPVGRWLSMREDAYGLHVRGKLNLKTSGGRDAFAHIMDGDVTGLSIGYHIPRGGSDFNGGFQQIKQAVLHEVSIVTLPMNPLARIRLGSKGELEELLTKSGLAKEAAKRVAFGGWPALNRNPDEENLAALIEAVKASARRF